MIDSEGDSEYLVVFVNWKQFYQLSMKHQTSFTVGGGLVGHTLFGVLAAAFKSLAHLSL